MGIKIDTTQFNIPPGETIKDEIRYVGMSQKELAERMGITEKAVSEIMNGKVALTIETAIKLETILGINADFWMNLENNYRISKIKNTEIVVDSTEEALSKNYSGCYRFLAKRGFVKQTLSPKLRTIELRNFFGVSNLLFASNLDYGLSFRKSNASEVDEFALRCLLRIGEVEARDVSIKPYNRDALISSLNKIRQLTTTDIPTALTELRELLNSVGVKIIYTESLPKTLVNGVVKWMGDNPMVQITDFRKQSDIFWFTLFHELGHVLLHARNKRNRFVDTYGVKNDSQEEIEADEFSQNTLIPKNEYKGFVNRGDFSELTIESFSRKVGVSPDVVAGRLAHDKEMTGYDFRFTYKYRKPVDFSLLTQN